jgi:dTMP kinase
MMARGAAHRGMLIVFEGAEGAGKTTQLHRLAARLAGARIPSLHLREPGGTPSGEQIRALLLDPAHQLTPAGEALLFMASRAELVVGKIRPALDAGKIVLLDRFFLSTYAYQVAGRGLDEAEVRGANQLAVQGLVPDVTVVLDLPVAAGMGRADARGTRDRMEQAGDAFHQRVGAAFRSYLTPEWQQQHPECGPIVRVDAVGSEEEVFSAVIRVLSSAAPETFGRLVESNVQ